MGEYMAGQAFHRQALPFKPSDIHGFRRRASDEMTYVVGMFGSVSQWIKPKAKPQIDKVRSRDGMIFRDRSQTVWVSFVHIESCFPALLGNRYQQWIRLKRSHQMHARTFTGPKNHPMMYARMPLPESFWEFVTWRRVVRPVVWDGIVYESIYDVPGKSDMPDAEYGRIRRKLLKYPTEDRRFFSDDEVRQYIIERRESCRASFLAEIEAKLAEAEKAIADH